MTEPVMTEAADESDNTETAISVDEIRRIIDADKTRADEVVKAARMAHRTSTDIVFATDMTGAPTIGGEHLRYKREQRRNLEKAARDPFYQRFTTRKTIGGKTEETEVLVSAARDVGGAVFGDDWMLTSWTSPLAQRLSGHGPGDHIELKQRFLCKYKIDSTSHYERLLPEVVNGRFALRTGEAAVADEAELLELISSQLVSGEIRPTEYQAKATFGLDDIIVLVDEPQRAALALPFEKSVIIEGPPGSGKTSVGIMRIAVLYDQQWEERGLDRTKDKPFHDYQSMRIMVYNQEMVEYLRNLAQQIGINHVQVSTTADVFRKICRSTKLLSGTSRRDKTSLEILKGRREALHAYFAGFQRHVSEYWNDHEQMLRQSLFALGSDFLTLADRMSQWVDRVFRASVSDGQIDGAIGLADGLTDEIERIRAGASPTRGAASSGKQSDHYQESDSSLLDVETISARAKEARDLVEAAVRGACDRSAITKSMFKRSEYSELLESVRSCGVGERVVSDGDRLWKKQYEGDLPAYSEFDLAMTAWLGTRILLSRNDRRKPWIGARLERLTHLVIDEAQDLSPSHIAVLASQLDREGTMTVVGDIHQNLNPYAGLTTWEDANLSNVVMSVFGVNHRQTRQLGEFLQGLHTELFDEPCPWDYSNRTVGKIPRIGVARSWIQLAKMIVSESRYWRAMITGDTGATIAVLYDGRIKPKRLKWLQSQVEAGLSDQLVPVELAMPRDGGESLRRTDRVVIASVRQAKGLEFDAVVFIEPRPRWSKPAREVDLRTRNHLYVATSRARAGLSLCMSNLPSCFEELEVASLCETIDSPEESE